MLPLTVSITLSSAMAGALLDRPAQGERAA
jgi:hypothetical protein